MSIFGSTTRRQQVSDEPVSRELYSYFTAGIVPSLEWQQSAAPAAREFRTARFFGGPAALRALWLGYRERVLVEWRVDHKGAPWAARHLEGRAARAPVPDPRGTGA